MTLKTNKKKKKENISITWKIFCKMEEFETRISFVHFKLKKKKIKEYNGYRDNHLCDYLSLNLSRSLNGE